MTGTELHRSVAVTDHEGYDILLPIKKQWFDMIRSGEKREEYRKLGSYYAVRFRNAGLLSEESEYVPTGRNFIVLFRNGYSKKSPQFKALCRLRVGTGNPQWGAENGETYYVIEIKEIYAV